jgi:hypothetical protein
VLFEIFRNFQAVTWPDWGRADPLAGRFTRDWIALAWDLANRPAVGLPTRRSSASAPSSPGGASVVSSTAAVNSAGSTAARACQYSQRHLLRCFVTGLPNSPRLLRTRRRS